MKAINFAKQLPFAAFATITHICAAGSSPTQGCFPVAAAEIQDIVSLRPGWKRRRRSISAALEWLSFALWQRRSQSCSRRQQNECLHVCSEYARG